MPLHPVRTGSVFIPRFRLFLGQCVLTFFFYSVEYTIQCTLYIIYNMNILQVLFPTVWNVWLCPPPSINQVAIIEVRREREGVCGGGGIHIIKIYTQLTVLYIITVHYPSFCLVEVRFVGTRHRRRIYTDEKAKVLLPGGGGGQNLLNSLPG